jgi:hypothetical protein
VQAIGGINKQEKREQLENTGIADDRRYEVSSSLQAQLGFAAAFDI